MENLFSVELLAMSTIAVKFVVDIFPCAKYGVKMGLSTLASMFIVFSTHSDVAAELTHVESTWATMVVSSLLLAAVTSKVVHPVLEKSKEVLKRNGNV